jgi:uncharacterized protein YjiS (DUF1127 family)
VAIAIPLIRLTPSSVKALIRVDDRPSFSNTESGIVRRHSRALKAIETPDMKETTMTVRIDIQQPSTSAATIWRKLPALFGRLVSRCIANVIARREREAALAALRQLDDRKLKDIGIDRCQIDDAIFEIARERTRLQRCWQS